MRLYDHGKDSVATANIQTMTVQTDNEFISNCSTVLSQKSNACFVTFLAVHQEQFQVYGSTLTTKM